MEGLKVDGRMKVKTLKANFKKAFGFSLRVYNTQNHFVDEELLLANVRQDDNTKTGACEINPEWTVDEFEKAFMEAFAIKVQVAVADDSALADNSAILVSGKTLKVDGRMKVKTLKEAFKELYGFTLRVYNSQNHFVDDDLLLANVRQDATADKSDELMSLKEHLWIISVSRFRLPKLMIQNLLTTTSNCSGEHNNFTNILYFCYRPYEFKIS